MHSGSVRRLPRLLARSLPLLSLGLLLGAADPVSAQAPGTQTPGPEPAPAADTLAPAEPTPLRGVTLGALRADPDRYLGRVVHWRGQFLSVATADSLRTDLRPGETYLLAREPGGEPGYAYVVVPPHLLAAVRRLVPLERVEIVGRVRTGRSPLMGHPVLDLEALVP